MQELRIARSKAGMTLMELEAVSGVGASTISKIERGVSRPQAGTLHKLADALGVEVGELYPKKAQAPPETKTERRQPDHVYEFDPEPRITAEQLREHGIEVNNSELIVLNQYIQVEERPPTGVYTIGHVVKEGEPVDHDRVRGILLYLLSRGLLSREQAEAVGEKTHTELAGARS